MPSKREILKKKTVLASPSFQKWWRERRNMSSVPDDPYRAYMIDLGIPAKIKPQPIWAVEPNRGDIVDSDFPFGGARNLPSPEEKKPRHPYVQRMARRGGSMAERHGIEKPDMHFPTSDGALGSYTYTGVGVKSEGGFIRKHKGETVVGVRGRSKGSRAQQEAALYHELGHNVHAHKSAKGEPLLKGLTPYTGSGKDYMDEHAATAYAMLEIKRNMKGKRVKIQTIKSPVEQTSTFRSKVGQKFTATHVADISKSPKAIGNWTLRYALQTYQEGWKDRGNPVKMNKDGTFTGGKAR